MAIQERFEKESVGRDEILHFRSGEEGCACYEPEEGCIKYEPRTLERVEHEFNAERDTFFAEEFFGM